MKKTALILLSCLLMLCLRAQNQYYLFITQTSTGPQVERKLLDPTQVAELNTSKLANTTIHIDHKLRKRKLPNDPLQAYQNFIQELELPNLWNYSIGGKLRNNKQINVAVIDDGIDTFHKDLKDNIYINPNEIGGNGIDDDNNDYIDDVIGWNSADSNGTVYGLDYGTHATPIAGIIGAKGDNNFGVTGINWNIKILNITCFGAIHSTEGSESAVFAGFEYIIKNKKLYNQTAGLRGIDIHIISLSVGLERSFPDDSPLWCQYIDTLNQLGILVCAATTNANINVDIDGDLPATCANSNLITVNQGTNLPIKSGYGVKYIHLSANGSDVYSTQSTHEPKTIDGYYNKFTGTSFTSPQAAGTGALLLSLACKSYLQLMADSPAVAAAWLKNWILHTKYQPGLQGHNMNSGILNARLAWNALDSWCIAHDTQYKTSSIVSLPLPLFPNPVASGNSITVQLPYANLPVMLYNTSGKLVHSTQTQQQKIQLPNLPSGLYLVRINHQRTQYMAKIYIE